MEETKVTPQAGAKTGGDARGPRRDASRAPRGKGGAAGPRGRGGREGGRPPREKPEFDTKMISIRRVTRVVAGGRRFSLSVAVVCGDRRGRIGLGTGKAVDTQVAIEKAAKMARKNMMHLKLSGKHSLPYEVEAKYKSAKVLMRPNGGKGMIAGSAARVILSLAGIADTTVKFHSGTKNKLNNARATMKALAEIAYPRGEEPVPATKVEVVEAVAETK